MPERTTGIEVGPESEPLFEAGRNAAIAVGLTAVLAVLLLAFALPAVKSAPHEIPIGVVGSDTVAAQLDSRDGAFEVTAYQDEATARQAVLTREIYGAFIVGTDGVRVLTATASSQTVASTIRQAGASLAAQSETTVDVVDLRTFPADDPRGAGLSAGALPLALGGFIGAVAISQVVPTTRRRTGGIAAFVVVAGFGLTAVLQYVVGTFDGNYLLTSLAAALGLAATAYTILGLRTLFGPSGLGLGALLIVLLGNPLSGLASAPEMLPTPWGAIGQLLPPGATGTLLRNTVYFDGNATLQPVIILGCWLLIGLALTAIGAARHRVSAAVPDREPKPEAAL